MHWDLQTLNNLNPVFLNNSFHLRETERPIRSKYKLNLVIPKTRQVKFDSECLRCLGPTIWNNLPHHIKSSKNLQNFKEAMKFWNSENCECSLCQSIFSSTSPPSRYLIVRRWQWWHWCFVWRVFGAGTEGTRTLLIMTFWSLYY